MDLRVLCVFVAVAYVDVSARITCNFQPKSWASAMLHCLNLQGTPVGISSVLSLTGLHLNGSFWTADYASRIATTDSPVECEYRTLELFKPISQPKLGNCEVTRNYVCCDNSLIKSCVQNGTWKEASRCNDTFGATPAVLPIGDYWFRGAYGYQNNTFTGESRHNIDRCGIVDVNGDFQFVSDCRTSHYSFCEVGNYTGSDLSVCGSTLTTNQPSSNNPSTFISQKTETFTTTIMSINKNTTTTSLVRSHASSSSEFKTSTTVQQQTEIFTATTMLSNNENTTTESIVRSHDSSPSAFKTETTVQQQTKTLPATIMSINENTTTESIVRNHASSLSGTTVQQQIETLTPAMVSINENTATESIVRNHDSSSSDSALGIALGVSLSIVVIAIVTIVSICVYTKRKSNAHFEGSIEECGRTELGDIHVYDEISNTEELAYAASMVDFYDKIRTDGEKEHVYESLHQNTSQMLR